LYSLYFKNKKPRNVEISRFLRGGAYKARIYTLILNTFRDLSRFLKETAGRSDAKLARSGARLQATAEMKGGELAITFHPTT
jgi:hypothetical protein